MEIIAQLVLHVEAPALPYGPFITKEQAISQGIAYYYSGLQCKRGHFAARTVNSRNCLACLIQVHNKKPRIRTEQQLERARARCREHMREKRAAMTAAQRRDLTASRNDYILSYINSRRQADSDFRLRMNLRHRVWTALKGSKKTGKTIDLIGCAIPDLKAHLERQFLPGMSWDNYGQNGWHVDHIQPCSSFDLTDPGQQRLCFHYTNLQPLWASENIKKGSKIV